MGMKTYTRGVCMIREIMHDHFNLSSSFFQELHIFLDMLQTIIAFLLFGIEWFHIWGHSLILFRVRLLPRKDLVRIRLYFFVDTLSVFVSSIIFTGKLRWLAVLQIMQHMYYFLCWDKTYPAKKVCIVIWESKFSFSYLIDESESASKWQSFTRTCNQGS